MLISILADGGGLSLLACSLPVWPEFSPESSPLTGEFAASASLPHVDVIPIVDMENLFEMLRMCCGKI